MSYLVWNKVELDLISDDGMYLCFENGMRGGVSYISKTYSKANNRYLTSCNPKKPTKYVRYLYKNNLYGYSMSKSIPTSRFKWLDPAKFKLDRYDDGSSRGCV